MCAKEKNKLEDTRPLSRITVCQRREQRPEKTSVLRREEKVAISVRFCYWSHKAIARRSELRAIRNPKSELGLNRFFVFIPRPNSIADLPLSLARSLYDCVSGNKGYSCVCFCPRRLIYVSLLSKASHSSSVGPTLTNSKVHLHLRCSVWASPSLGMERPSTNHRFTAKRSCSELYLVSASCFLH